MRPLTDPTLRRLLRARDRLHADWDGPVTIEDLAGAAGLSRWHFQRSFRDAFGVTPHDYLSRLRLERAKELLARGVSVTEVCFSVGFVSPGSFSSWFSRGAGLSPVRWQRTTRRIVQVPGRLPLLSIPACFLVRFAPSTSEEVADLCRVLRTGSQGGTLS